MPALVPGAKRKIYRGDYAHNDPQQKELRASAAGFRPGQLLAEVGGEFALATAGAALFNVCNAPMHGDPLTYVYADDESVNAYIPRSRDYYLVRATAATYAAGTPLAIGANGTVVAASGTAAIIGFAFTTDGSAQVATAGQPLIDMRVA